MIKLSDCKNGDQFLIGYLDGNDIQKRHLQTLGFIPSKVINVVSNMDNKMIIKVMDVTVGIDSKIADHINGTLLHKEKVLRRSK